MEIDNNKDNIINEELNNNLKSKEVSLKSEKINDEEVKNNKNEENDDLIEKRSKNEKNGIGLENKNIKNDEIKEEEYLKDPNFLKWYNEKKYLNDPNFLQWQKLQQENQNYLLNDNNDEYKTIQDNNSNEEEYDNDKKNIVDSDDEKFKILKNKKMNSANNTHLENETQQNNQNLDFNDIFKMLQGGKNKANNKKQYHKTNRNTNRNPLQEQSENITEQPHNKNSNINNNNFINELLPQQTQQNHQISNQNNNSNLNNQQNNIPQKINNDFQDKQKYKDYRKKKQIEIAEAEELVKQLKKAGDGEGKYLAKQLEKVLKDVKDKEGGMAPEDIVDFCNDLQGKYGEYIKNGVEISQKELNLTNWPNIIIKILNFLGFRKFKHLQGKGDFKINEKSAVQVIPVRSQIGHFGVIIVDNVNKKISIFDPNGDCLENMDDLTGVKTKQELIKKVFNSKDADFLIKNNYGLCDAYHYSGCIKTGEKGKKIFDVVNNIDEIKNGDQTKDGACCVVGYKFISKYLKIMALNRGAPINNYGMFLKDINDNFNSTTDSLMYVKLHKMRQKIAKDYANKGKKKDNDKAKSNLKTISGTNKVLS